MTNRFFPNYPHYKITSPFGVRTHPVTKIKKMHNGIDLVASKDGKTGQVDYILAHTGGTVEAVGYGVSAGYYVKIRVDSKTVMVYYHLSKKSQWKKGATVKKGDRIGYMGKTGTATGAHLHWGIQKDGKWIDPTPYLDKDYPIKEENTVEITMNVLKKGAKGEQVKTLQRLLLSLGYNLEGYGTDGSFGGATERAVKSFQKNVGLTADGSVGKDTWNKLLKG
jgi:hypothetical protein